MTTQWRRISIEWRRAPLILHLTLSICFGLLVASIVLIALQVYVAGDGVVGLFGAAIVVLGAVLAFNVRSAAEVMARISMANHGGGSAESGRSWSAQRYRALGIYFLVFGLVLAGFAWSGSLHWHR